MELYFKVGNEFYSMSESYLVTLKDGSVIRGYFEVRGLGEVELVNPLHDFRVEMISDDDILSVELEMKQR